MTAAGYRALNDELNRLKSVDRPKIINEVEIARAHGDLRENAEYHAAREKYGFIEGRISALADKIATAQVINISELSGEKVIFGATVVLEDINAGDEVRYQIVGEDESDVKQGRISYLSPLARSLLGKEAGDEVEVRAPGGTKTYEILRVEFK